MPYLLDTSVISALMRGEVAVEERLLSETPASVYLAQPAIAEIRYGLARMPASRRRAALSKRFELLTETLTRAEWSDDVSSHFGIIKARLEQRGERIEDFDVAMAAHAVSLGTTLATRNLKHFSRVVGLDIERW